MNAYVVVAFLAGVVFLRSCYAVYARRTEKGILFLKKCRNARVSNAHLKTVLPYNPFEIVIGVSRRAGISPPETLIVPKVSSCAGMTPICGKNILVCELSLLQNCSPEEFEGVIAHEIGHLFSGKMCRCLEYGTFGLFSQIEWFPGYLGVAMVLSPTRETFWTIAPIFFALALVFTIGDGCRRFFRRQEEFAADKKALSLTRYPSAFVHFLSKIETKSGSETPMRREDCLRAFFNDTHPPGWRRAAAAEKILKKQSMKK